MTPQISTEIDAGIAAECLGIEVTTRCNASCRYCFVMAGRGRSAELAFEEVRAILSEAYRLGYRKLQLTGGEPLLWDGLYPTLAYAATRGYETVLVNTNGTRLTPTASRHLAAFGNVWLSVSLQGPEDFHRRMRPHTPFAAIHDHLAVALDVGLNVSIFTTVFKSVLPVIPRFACDMFAAYPGLYCLALIQLVRVPGDAVDLSEELLTPEAFLMLVQMAALLRLYGLKVDVLNNPLVAVAADLLGLPWQSWTHPLTMPGRIMIRANGDVSVSHSAWWTFGRYRPGRLETLLSSPRYAAALAEDDRICPRCPFVKRCRDFKMVRPSERSKNVKDDRPFCRTVLEAACRRKTKPRSVR